MSFLIGLAVIPLACYALIPALVLAAWWIYGKR
jgi:hypothetical protein